MSTRRYTVASTNPDTVSRCLAIEVPAGQTASVARKALDYAQEDGAFVIITADHWPRAQLTDSVARHEGVRVEPDGTVADVAAELQRLDLDERG